MYAYNAEFVCCVLDNICFRDIQSVQLQIVRICSYKFYGKSFVIGLLRNFNAGLRSSLAGLIFQAMAVWPTGV